MPTLKELAHVTVRGRDLIDDDTQTEAWMLYSLVREATRDEDAYTHNNEAGFSWAGSVHEKVLELWPSLPTDRFDKQTANKRQRITDYLKKSGNMVCLQRGNLHRPSIWWLRDEWSWQKPTTQTSSKMSDAERRLTPTEAGEDREPAPVTVTHREPDALVGAVKLLDSSTHDCPQCPARFLTSFQLHSHMSKNSGREHQQGRYPCPLCPTVVNSTATLSQHVSRRHRNGGQVCSVCGHVSPSGRSEAMRHQREVHGVKFGVAGLEAANAAKQKLTATKTCSKCGLSKSRDQYWRYTRSQDGLQAWCKTCMTKANKEAEDRRMEEAKARWARHAPEETPEPAPPNVAVVQDLKARHGHSEPKPKVEGDDPIYAITQLVDDYRKMKEENTDLHVGYYKLKEENDDLRAKLERIYDAIGGEK